ncbi:MAG: hypothetical protein RR238_04460 [Lachnospiraceae bacterium]
MRGCGHCMISTLFVGIDVSSKSNVVYAMDFDENKYIASSISNNQPGADKLAELIFECMLISLQILPELAVQKNVNLGVVPSILH